MASIRDYIAQALPEGVTVEVANLRSIAKESSALTIPLPGYRDNLDKTIKVEHFIVLSCGRKTFFAIQVYVFLTVKNSTVVERLFYISKADTNGYCTQEIGISRLTKAILTYLLALNPLCYLSSVKPLRRNLGCKEELITKETSCRQALRIMANRILTGKATHPKIESSQAFLSYDEMSNDLRTKICLFTRPEPQYLFPNSSLNSKKHLLNGEQLLSWWLTIIDEIIIADFERDSLRAKLKLPGEDLKLVHKILERRHCEAWQEGDIFEPSQSNLAVLSFPVFPDDPKSRFLEALIEENRATDVNREEFWAELQGRQEFRLGVTVSVIGICGKTKKRLLYPIADETIEASSRSGMESLKSFITGEQYDTDEGASDAYMNLTDFLQIGRQRAQLSVIGQLKTASCRNQVKRPAAVVANVLDTNLVRRKKPKRAMPASQI
ncbi:LAMI_0H09120g1_1 [Lachancea mirantina]|uniref:histone acetyltransferase n=1 Tax=Lachancea mirantina TaxID=1230905 RepID=A0A1G4KG88_9SACH|nr:LAMI_0H09120g1_1 [Lachancea mirantina]